MLRRGSHEVFPDIVHLAPTNVSKTIDNASEYERSGDVIVTNRPAEGCVAWTGSCINVLVPLALTASQASRKNFFNCRSAHSKPSRDMQQAAERTGLEDYLLLHLAYRGL